MGPVRAKTRRLGSLFAFHAPAPEPDYGEPVMHRGTVGLPRIGALDGVGGGGYSRPALGLG